jgi:hypothetical protein
VHGTATNAMALCGVQRCCLGIKYEHMHTMPPNTLCEEDDRATSGHYWMVSGGNRQVKGLFFRIHRPLAQASFARNDLCVFQARLPKGYLLH